MKKKAKTKTKAVSSKPNKQPEGTISTNVPENRHVTGTNYTTILSHKPATKGVFGNGVVSPDVGKATQFQPGVSPNPGGRPKDLVSDAQKDLLKKIDEATGKTNAELIAEAQLKVALSGDTSAYCAIRDTTEGRPTQKVTVDGNAITDRAGRVRELVTAALERRRAKRTVSR